MAKTITPINTATDTFNTWVIQANVVIDTISTECLTANNNANGGFVTGNSQLFGIFTANTIAVYDELRGGNVQSSGDLTIASNLTQNNSFTFNFGNSTVNAVVNSVSVTLSNSTVVLSLTKPTAAEISDGGYYLNADGSWKRGAIISNTQCDTISTTVEVDNFLKATYRSGEFLFSVRDMNANGYQTQKCLVIHDDNNTNAYITEYGVLISNTSLGTFTANANTTHVLVHFTNDVANTVVISNKTLMTV